jgi:GNAT superfamily N-acetyltransferase
MIDSTEFNIRPATAADLPELLRLVQKLAEYERLADHVSANESLFQDALFGDRPCAEALLGLHHGSAVAYAIFFHTFSTFLGRRGMYIEDIFVDEECRGRGFGKAMFLKLVRIAHERGCGRLEWSALDWNEHAIRFYRGMGAQALDEWTVYRLDDAGIARLCGAT